MDTKRTINQKTPEQVNNELRAGLSSENEKAYLLDVISRLDTVLGFNYSVHMEEKEEKESGHLIHAMLTLKDDAGLTVTRRDGYASEKDCTFASQMALANAAQLFGVPPYTQNVQTHKNCTYEAHASEKTASEKQQKATATNAKPTANATQNNNKDGLVTLSICSEWQQAKNGQYFCYVAANQADLSSKNKPIIVLGGKAQARIAEAFGNVKEYINQYGPDTIFKCYCEKRMDEISGLTEYIMLDVFVQN